MGRKLATVAVVVFAMFGVTGVAQASVVVPPGANGHTCSQNVPVDWGGADSLVYWQTCAWADNNEVYFTVHVGNGYNQAVIIDEIWLRYVRAGVEYKCTSYINFAVAAHSVRGTPTAYCAKPRVRGAYLARARVFDDVAYDRGASSPTLQVQ